jgi:dehydrogenase/reductase SDR family member 12
LELSVVGSFSKLGPSLRRRTAQWVEPPSPEGRVVVITGATSGLGLEAASALSLAGAQVSLVGRDPHRLDAARRLLEDRGASGVVTELADLADLNDVEALAGRLLGRLGRLDVLIHNAGALSKTYVASPQGVEATLAVHLLAPYLLTERLQPLLASSAPSRVITMTSGGMYTQRFDLDALEMPPDRYRGSVAYARAKRAQVLLTQEWQRRYGAQGIDFFATHPGWADTPGLTAGLPTFAQVLRPLLRSAREGVDTELWLATSADVAHRGGTLWLDRRERGAYHLPWTWVPPERRAEEARALWEWCEAIVKR